MPSHDDAQPQHKPRTAAGAMRQHKYSWQVVPRSPTTIQHSTPYTPSEGWQQHGSAAPSALSTTEPTKDLETSKKARRNPARSHRHKPSALTCSTRQRSAHATPPCLTTLPISRWADHRQQCASAGMATEPCQAHSGAGGVAASARSHSSAAALQ
jgi:hypothetical protein